MRKFIPILLVLSAFVFPYRLKVGDVVGVSIYTMDGIIDRTFKVDDEGFAPVPFVGTMKVAGMDTRILEGMIEGEISRIHPDAVVTVYILKPAPERVFFHGAVVGYVNLAELKTRRLSEVLSYLGNLKNFPNADFSSVKVIRKDRTVIVDLEKFLKTGDVSYDFDLEDGDVVVVPEMGKVGIFGSVMRPGFFDYKSKMGLLELISAAGGLREDADEESITIFKRNSKMTVKFKDLLSGKDVELEKGDVVFVPKVEPVYVYVSGYVKSPGIVNFFKQKPTLSKAIAMRGGFLDEDKVKLVRITRNGTELVVPPSSDVILENGDLVKVESFKKIRVYVIGFNSGYVEFYENEKPDLRKLISKMRLNFAPDTTYMISILRNGKEVFQKKVNSSGDVPDVLLEDNDAVLLEVEEPVSVYVSGYVKRGGLLKFSPFENPTLSNLLYKASPLYDRGKIYLTRKGSTTVYDLESVLKGSTDTSLKSWDLVYVEYEIEEKVHIVGGKINGIVLKDGISKLSDVVAMAAKDFVSYSRVKLIRRNGEKFSFKFEDIIERKVDEDLEDGDIVVLVERKPKRVYVIGDVSRELVFQPDEKVSTETIISKLSVRESDVESIEGELEDGVLRITLKKPVTIYLTGDVKIVGGMVLEGEDARLKRALFKAGVLVKMGTVEIRRMGSTLKYNLSDVISGEADLRLEDGDYITVKGIGWVSIVGVRPSKLSLDRVETLRDLLANVEYPFTPEKVEILRESTVISLGFEDSFSSNVKLVDGDIVVFRAPGDKVVYVVGDVSRAVVFKPGERIDRDSLVSKLGVREDEIESIEGELRDDGIVRVKIRKPVKVYAFGDVQRRGEIVLEPGSTSLRELLGKLGVEEGYTVEIISNGSSTVLSVSDVISNKANLKLKDGDVVFFRSPGKVGIEGYGFVELTGIEKLSDVLKMVKIDISKVDYLILWREGKKSVFKPSDVLSGDKDVNLEDGDFVSFEMKKEKIVYVVGDVGAVVRFSPDEPLNEETLLSKLGIPKSKILKIEGKVKDGSVIGIIFKKIVRVYVTGVVKRPGVIEFSPDEEPSLKNLLAKVGGADERLKVVKILRDGKTISEFSKDEIFKEEFYLKDGDYVRFESTKELKVRVFGEGVKQGLYMVNEGSTLEDLIARMGGLDRDVSKLTLYRGDTVRTFEISYDKISNITLEDGDTLVFGKVENGFIYILGDVRSPGAIFVGKDSVPLLKILGMVGGLSDWAGRSKIVVKREGRDVEINLKNIDEISNFKLIAGDVVYVPPLEIRRAYVLGSVVRPGIVPVDEDSTLLDAILKSGGFKKGADEGRVYVFRGGVKGPVEIYDMSWFRKGRTGKNPKLKPGDIVFVPDNTITSITEVIGIINTMLGFLNNVINTYENVEGIIGR